MLEKISNVTEFCKIKTNYLEVVNYFGFKGQDLKFDK